MLNIQQTFIHKTHKQNVILPEVLFHQYFVLKAYKDGVCMCLHVYTYTQINVWKV